MNIAICQLNFTVGDINGNTEKIIEQIEIHKNMGVDLVLFPEMSISGLPLYDMVDSPNFIDKCYSALSEIAETTKDIAVLLGMPTISGDDTFNSVVYLKNGVVADYFSKAMPTSRDEMPYFAGVDSPTFYDEQSSEQNEEFMPIYTISVAGQTALVIVGEDIGFLNEMDTTVDYDIIIQIASRHYSHGVIEEDLDFLSVIAKELKVPLITCNAVGASTDIVYYGASAAFNDMGCRIVKMSNFEEDVQIVATSAKSIQNYKTIKISPSTSSSQVRHDYKAIVLGLRDYFEKSGFKTACLGLSGGIDSAVVLAVAVDALGAENVRVLMLPSHFSSSHSVSDSVKLAKTLGVKCEMVEIEPIYTQFINSLSTVCGNTPFSVAEENLQSRIRGTILMFLSNKFGNLLLNTTNKSEACMGYGTLYGDTNGAISILGDLYKTEVYALAEYINRGGEVIPRSIIIKAPSAELRPDQKDSDTLPEYDILDKILYHLIEENMSVMEVASEGYDIELVSKINKAIKNNEHKRYQLAPSIRLSKCVLGKDRVMPIVSK